MSHHPDADVEEEGVTGEAAQAQDPSVADQIGGEDETQLQDGTNGTQVDQEEPVLPLQDKDDGIITQELLRKYIVYARSTVRPQLQNIDQERVAQLYADLRRDSISAGGVPIAVRHVESIMRMAEGYAKMHLRPYVRDDDLDMAIRVMVESFISAQKYAVQRTLRRKFHKYLVHKKDNNSLLMYLLQTLVREQQTYRSIGPSNGQQVIEVQLDDLEARARELNIHNLQTFFKSDVFNSHGFELDTRERTILRAI